MLKSIVEFSVRHRGVVAALACAAVVFGAFRASRAKLDVFPNFVPPQVGIQTEAPGLSAEQVEQLVTRPVEAAVAGVGNLESLRSQSAQGLSVITAVFKEGADVFQARQLVAEQLAEMAASLPAGVRPPRATPLVSSTMDLLKIGLTSKKLTSMELRTFADWTLAPRLRAVPGVAKVSLFGGDVRQFQIQVKPERMQTLGLTFDDVLSAARAATGLRGAGFTESDAQRIPIQTEGQATTAEAIGEAVVVARDGLRVRLADVADVRDGVEPKIGDCLIQGGPGVLLTLLSQYGANTMEVTEAVEAALAEIDPAMKAQGIEVLPRLHRPATFIENSIEHIRHALLAGAILVTVVLFLFLFNLRSAFISITAIPLSLLTAVVVLDWLGYTLDTITLGGLAIAIGEVVDDAIIDVENIFRRLREHGDRLSPGEALRVVLDASLEVRGAVVYATFVVALVFVPVLTLSGVQGRLFAPLGMAYILAILASLLVALTVTPALCMLLLPGRAKAAREPFFLRGLKSGYLAVMHGVLRHAGAVIVATVVVVGGAVWLLRGFGGELLPEFREGHFVVQVSTIPGTSFAEMKRLGAGIIADLRKIPEIATCEQQIGRSELGEDPWGPNRSEIHVELKDDVPGERQAEVQEEIRAVLVGYPGIQTEVLTFLGDRMGESISGETAPVVVNVYGEDLDALDATAREIQAALARAPGAVDVRMGTYPATPQTNVRLRPERLRQFGLRALDVMEAVQAAYEGATVSQVYEENRTYDVVVILPPDQRREPEAIGGLLLRTPEGSAVRLDQLADVFAINGRAIVLHDGARRRQVVTCGVKDRDLSGFAEEAEALVRKAVKLSTGVYYAFGGAATERAEASRELLVHSSIAGLGIVLLLAMVFRNGPNLLLVLANLPFALVGGVLAVRFTGATLSIGSLVGFVTLFGITMRNSVMMISHFEHLVSIEGKAWGVETALRGAAERLVPILMTALVTGLGLLPIAWGAGEVGREIEGPMAIVILGGLATSTLLSLLVLPTLALRFGRFGNHGGGPSAGGRQ